MSMSVAVETVPRAEGIREVILQSRSYLSLGEWFPKNKWVLAKYKDLSRWYLAQVVSANAATWTVCLAYRSFPSTWDCPVQLISPVEPPATGAQCSYTDKTSLADQVGKEQAWRRAQTFATAARPVPKPDEALQAKKGQRRRKRVTAWLARCRRLLGRPKATGDGSSQQDRRRPPMVLSQAVAISNAWDSVGARSPAPNVERKDVPALLQPPASAIARRAPRSMADKPRERTTITCALCNHDRASHTSDPFPDEGSGSLARRDGDVRTEGLPSSASTDQRLEPVPSAPEPALPTPRPLAPRPKVALCYDRALRAWQKVIVTPNRTRPGTVPKNTVRVHYVGWSSKYDETIDLAKDGWRIKDDTLRTT